MSLPIHAILLVATNFLLAAPNEQKPASITEIPQRPIPEELLAKIRPIEAKEQEIGVAILKRYPGATVAKKKVLLEPIRQETIRQVVAILATQEHVDVAVQLEDRLRTKELPAYALSKMQQVDQVRARSRRELLVLQMTMLHEASSRRARIEEVRSKASSAIAAVHSTSQQAYAAFSQKPDQVDSGRVRQAQIIEADQAARCDLIRIWQEQGLAAIAIEEGNVAADRSRRIQAIEEKASRDIAAILKQNSLSLEDP